MGSSKEAVANLSTEQLVSGRVTHVEGRYWIFWICGRGEIYAGTCPNALILAALQTRASRNYAPDCQNRMLLRYLLVAPRGFAIGKRQKFRVMGARGRSWALFGCFLGVVWALLGATVRSWALPCASCAFFGALLGHSRGRVLQPQRLNWPPGCCNLRG